MLIVALFKVLIVTVLSHLISFLIFSSAEADPSGGNADLSSHAHYVSVQTAPGAVWLQWACCQPPSGCGLLLSQSAPPSLSTGRHRRQEGGGQPEPSGLPCQTCSGAQSSPVAGCTQPVLPLCGCDHRHHSSGPAPTGWCLSLKTPPLTLRQPVTQQQLRVTCAMKTCHSHSSQLLYHR